MPDAKRRPREQTAKKEAIIKTITSRQQKLESDRTQWDDRLQDVADYVSPHRDDIRGTYTKGQRQGDKLFDGTAVSAAVLATDGIHGYHVSPAFPWFKYEMNRRDVNRLPEVRDWLQELEWLIYSVLNGSNFYGEMWPYIYDGFSLGTASIFPEEDVAEGRIVFEAVHPGETYIAENKYGEIDVFHRKRKLSARQLIQRFGDDVPEDVRNVAENQPFQEYEVIHAVYPREDFNSAKLDAQNKRFASCWLLSKGNHLLGVSGFDRFPYSVWRYMRTGKIAYGTSPAHLAMSDIKGLQVMGKTLLGAAQLAVDPAYNVPTYLEGKVQLKPRGLNDVKQGDAITSVSDVRGYPVGIDREQAKQQSIRDRFHVDTFLLLTQLASQPGQRTATEVIELVAEKAAILGAELGPLNSELDKILDRVYQIELDAGRLPSPPDILHEMAEEDPALRFDPVYLGPLAQAQRERFSRDWVTKFMTQIGPMAEVQPSILDNFDLDAGVRDIAENINMPADAIRDMQAVRQLREQKAAAMQAEEAKQDIERLAAAGKDVAALDKEGTLIDSIMGEVNAPA
jgi:hypothetical protein